MAALNIRRLPRMWQVLLRHDPDMSDISSAQRSIVPIYWIAVHVEEMPHHILIGSVRVERKLRHTFSHSVMPPAGAHLFQGEYNSGVS